MAGDTRSSMAREWARLRAALLFMTRLPVPHADLTREDFTGAVGYYPLAGIVIGMLAMAGYALGFAIGGHELAGTAIGALLALAVTLFATGALHEDGLADLFDGLGTASRERMLEVMRDSRLGTFGAVALFVTLGLKVVALAGLPPPVALGGLVLAHALSRLSAVIVIATSRYARADGAATDASLGRDRRGMAIAILTGLAVWLGFATLAGSGAGIAALIGTVLGHAGARLLFERRLGGYTGDCLGAVQQASELGVYLALLAWL